MLEAAFFRQDGIPGDVLYFPLDGFAIEIGQLRELFGRNIFDPNIRRISAAIVFAPVNLALGVVSNAYAVRRKARRVTHVRARAPGHSAVSAHDVKKAHEIFAALATEQHAAAVRSPAQHDIIRRMMR